MFWLHQRASFWISHDQQSGTAYTAHQGGPIDIERNEVNEEFEIEAHHFHYTPPANFFVAGGALFIASRS